MSDFSFICEHCRKESEFELYQVDGLEEHISTERRDAAAEKAEEFNDWIDPSDLRSSAALLGELSVAIEREDKSEARILLDKIASTLGENARERVEVARFSPQARTPVPLGHHRV